MHESSLITGGIRKLSMEDIAIDILHQIIDSFDSIKYLVIIVYLIYGKNTFKLIR